MQTPRIIAAASLAVITLLAGCSNGDSSSSSTTSLPPTTATTRSVGSLKAVLLTPADVPGTTGTDPTSGDDTDISACFPGNPLGVKADPNEAKGQDLSVDDASGSHHFSSSARQGTPEQVTAFVNTLASPSGSACALNAFKASIANDPKPPKVDPSGLSGTTSSAAVADGGAILAVTGNISTGGSTVPLAIDLLFFRKGSVLVFVSAGTIGGAAVPGQAAALGTTIAGRLT